MYWRDQRGPEVSAPTAELSLQATQGGPQLSDVAIAHTALAFEFGSPSEVDEIYRELVDVGLGSAHEPFDAPWGHRIATVRDPDGNNVDLYARLS